MYKTTSKCPPPSRPPLESRMTSHERLVSLCARRSASRGGSTEMAMRPGMALTNQLDAMFVITRIDEVARAI